MGFNVLDRFGRSLVFGKFQLGKEWEKRPFFQTDMARLVKYCYGSIGVHRVKAQL